MTHVRPKIDRLTKLSTTGFQLAGQSLEQTIHLSKTHSTKIVGTISSGVGGYLLMQLSTHIMVVVLATLVISAVVVVSLFQLNVRQENQQVVVEQNQTAAKSKIINFTKLKHRMRVTNTPSTINLEHLTTLLPLLFHSSPLQSQKNASIYRRSRRASNINRLRHRCALNVFRVNH